MMTPVAVAPSRRHFASLGQHWKEFVALGLFAALTTISQGRAYTLTLSSYVEAVKQVEILFAMASASWPSARPSASASPPSAASSC